VVAVVTVVAAVLGMVQNTYLHDQMMFPGFDDMLAKIGKMVRSWKLCDPVQKRNKR